MLSRVAAVMAPRTHNRRGVTGSRGRKREGGESERQRPNMSRRVFASAVPLLLVVMMCCSTCGGVQADEDLSVVPKYQLEDIADGNLKLFGIPGLLKVGSGVFAVAEVQCKKKDGDDTFTGIASRLLTIKDDNTPEEALKDARVIQVLEEGASTSKRVDVSRPTAVVKGSDIYMLVGKYSRKGGQESGADDWGLLLVKGTLSDKEESNKQIDWKDTNAVPTKPLGEQQNSLKRLIGGGGSGVKMDDGTLVFPLEGTHEKKDDTEEDGKTVSLLLYSKDTKSWNLSKGMSDDGCSDPSVVEWEVKLMMMTACDDGRRRVYEIGDKGTTWTEALGTLSRVWSSKHEGSEKLVGSGFTTATIDGVDDKNVMLVTLPVYAKENEKGVLHLWLTDNTHIVDIGPVSGEDDDAAASALLYKSGKSGNDEEKKEELIALYEKKKVSGESSNSLWSVRLTEQLQRVKDVLATWKEVDEHVSGLYPSESAVQARSTESACKNTKITAGLVGFLSGNFSENTWRDEYLGVNATVKKETKDGAPAGVAETAESSDGVTFTGRGAWAEWPVGRQGENQLYHFANYNFTLVAMVSIDGEPKEGPIPLMGAKMNEGDDKTVLLGLSYNKEKKWILLCGGKQKEMQNRIEEQEKTHQVAIVLQNGNQGSAYVDGQRLGEPCELETTNSKGISHFYIGGDGSNTEGQGGVSVTVTNVLLYNRPLDDNEITALNAIKPPITPPKETIAQEIVLPSFGGTPQAGQEPLNGGEGVGGGSASSAASIATTPSSDVAQTVATMGGDKMQGDGSLQTPDVSMSSGADRETAGGTDGQEEIHPQDREVNATALSSSLGNLSQGTNTDASTVSGSGLLPSLLLLLGLWGFAAA
ncbi:trans-sialidase [Trypanosoma cruzi Dm28c]|uniref:Trans-sialidase n=2 Tax=Trypanosoma cruzi TaxID=5693 RepID=V5B490_TRYCR|nr:trans-sialidase [Trypanosoma cruzi Dm28c]PBJ76455.1 trans-sialidase [Trypanosoma cruzi cruzi]PWU88822.1 putative trans-sialidase, Group VI [Trypanosoma cruzi]